jgi:hypothetical protein
VRGDMMMMTCQRAGGKKTIRERNQSAPALRFFEGFLPFLGDGERCCMCCVLSLGWQFG